MSLSFGVGLQGEENDQEAAPAYATVCGMTAVSPGAKFRRRSNSRRKSSSVAASCTAMARTERYQIQCSWNPGSRDSRTAGIATTTIRTHEATRAGIVLPMAWNILELTKITPEATNVHDTMFRYSTPIAMTCGSSEKTPTIAAPPTRHAMVQTTITPAAMSAADRNVARTRCGCRAPKFWPATGATAKPSATTGMKPA